MFNNPYYNPIPPSYNPGVQSPTQQRLNQYDYNDPMTKNLVKCRAVTSFDEAKAAMIDLDGSMTIFTDLGHNRIYTKQINLDGTATLNSYVLEKPVEPISADPNKTEERIEKLESALNDLREELNHVKSNANDGNDKSNSKKPKSNANDASNVR